MELCQQDVYIDVSQTDHSTMHMKTTCYMQDVSNKLANYNWNFDTWSFSRKMQKHYGAFKVPNDGFWRHSTHFIDIHVLHSKVIILAVNVLLLNKTREV